MFFCHYLQDSVSRGLGVAGCCRSLEAWPFRQLLWRLVQLRRSLRRRIGPPFFGFGLLAQLGSSYRFKPRLVCLAHGLPTVGPVMAPNLSLNPDASPAALTRRPLGAG